MIVQQNASSSEELAATAEELSGQAVQLSETISFFKTDANSDVKARHELTHEGHVAHTSAVAAKPRDTVTPGRTTTIALAKRESTTDRDFEEF
jgi:methyl-accepting chemotaxis protein